MSDGDGPLNAVRGLVESINGGNDRASLSAMTDDVVIIDDIAPFRLTGRSAAEGWLAWVATTRRHLHASLTLEDAEVRTAENSAYVLAPGHLTGGTASGRFGVSGLLTATLTKRDGEWLIDGLVWSSIR
jgi:ketosteroid isomerase-like protein